MFTFRRAHIALSLSALSLLVALSSCTKEPAAPAAATASQQLTTGSWRLDEIRQAGQVSSSGPNIKDRYSLTFRPDGTYTQKLLADNTAYQGTAWSLTGTSMLHLTDHKGAQATYTLLRLTPQELRYHFTNKANQTEEHVFSAQP
jgi:hypothetical protein